MAAALENWAPVQLEQHDRFQDPRREQTTAGLTLKPLQMTRFSDRIRLTLLVQNSTNDPIVLGQSNEILGAFKFGDQVKEAEKVQYIFQRLRTYADTNLEVKGLFDEYPNSVEIRRWKNIQVGRFTFNWGRRWRFQLKFKSASAPAGESTRRASGHDPGPCSPLQALFALFLALQGQPDAWYASAACGRSR
jgi:hypothetical protein